MKTITKIKLVFLLLSTGSIYAQFNPAALIAGSQADATYLVNGYLKPFGNSLATGLNNGWYQTARPHKLGRFDIMVTPSLIFIPAGDQNFLIENSKLQALEIATAPPGDNNASIEAATAFGAKNGSVALRVELPGGGGDTINTPGGLGIPLSAVPIAGINIGLIKNTDLAIRYLPTLAFPGEVSGSVSLFGFGIKHDILQWVSKEKAWPFDASVFFGYTNVKYTQNLNADDQKLSLESTGYTFRVLASKKLLFFTPYVGLGFNSGRTDINMTGTYTLESPIGPQQVPVNMNLTADDAGGFVANVGFRLKILWVLALSADYTLGAYNSATVGAGISLDF